MSDEVNAVGTAVLLAAAPAGRGRAMDAATVLPALAAVPAGALTGTHTATVVELADPLDPQAVLTRLRAAAAGPGPLTLCLAGQLQLDRRQRLPHLALARSTPSTLRYTGLPWHWLATELAPRRPGTTTVVADLAADPELWERLTGAGPGLLELPPTVSLFARITPFPRRGTLNTPDYLRHFAEVWRSGARPALATLHEEAGVAARTAGQETAILLGGGGADTPIGAPAGFGASTGFGAPRVPGQQTGQQTGQQEAARQTGQQPGHAEPAHAEPAHARAQEPAPSAYGASRPQADPPPAPVAASVPTPAPAPVPTSAPAPESAPAAVVPVPTPASAAVPAAVVPPRPSRAPEPAVGDAPPRPGGDVDPHPAILAAAMAGRHGEAAAMAAAWESDALRRYGPRSGEALHWVEVRADLARLAGEPARSCELWIAAAQARLGLRQEPHEPDVEGAVDRAHHQWEQITDPARARALGPALVELRRRVPGRHAGALAALQRRMGT
ncbi:hypothetical protein ACFYU9_17505 [Streptomyces sp. NPDC004327]|uniref:hypothetical protein n=1 Tax=Streptomyces sp. NPDC004327 TaxID=3364699 RepID=UPI00367775FF